MTALCRRGNMAWLTHDWNLKGVCKRCGATIPNGERAEIPTTNAKPNIHE